LKARRFFRNRCKSSGYAFAGGTKAKRASSADLAPVLKKIKKFYLKISLTRFMYWRGVMRLESTIKYSFLVVLA